MLCRFRVLLNCCQIRLASSEYCCLTDSFFSFWRTSARRICIRSGPQKVRGLQPEYTLKFALGLCRKSRHQYLRTETFSWAALWTFDTLYWEAFSNDCFRSLATNPLLPPWVARSTWGGGKERTGEGRQQSVIITSNQGVSTNKNIWHTQTVSRRCLIDIYEGVWRIYVGNKTKYIAKFTIGWVYACVNVSCSVW